MGGQNAWDGYRCLAENAAHATSCLRVRFSSTSFHSKKACDRLRLFVTVSVESSARSTSCLFPPRQ